MALPKIGFNEGSLLRRTLLHVGTFVLGSVAFIGLVSFVLVSVARGLVAPREVADDEPEGAATVAIGSPKPARPPGMKLPGGRNKRGAAAMGATPPPAND